MRRCFQTATRIPRFNPESEIELAKHAKGSEKIRSCNLDDRKIFLEFCSTVANVS